MGEPASFGIIVKWIYGIFDIKKNPGDQLKTLLFQPKY